MDGIAAGEGTEEEKESGQDRRVGASGQRVQYSENSVRSSEVLASQLDVSKVGCPVCRNHE